MRERFSVIDGEKSAPEAGLRMLLEGGVNVDSRRTDSLLCAFYDYFSLPVFEDITGNLRIPLERLAAAVLRIKELEHEEINFPGGSEGREGSMLSDRFEVNILSAGWRELNALAEVQLRKIRKALEELENAYTSCHPKKFFLDELDELDYPLGYWLGVMLFRQIGEVNQDLKRKLEEMSLSLDLLYMPSSISQPMVGELVMKLMRIRELVRVLKRFLRPGHEKISLDELSQMLTQAEVYPQYVFDFDRRLAATTPEIKSDVRGNAVKNFREIKGEMIGGFVRDKEKSLERRNSFSAVVVGRRSAIRWSLPNQSVLREVSVDIRGKIMGTTLSDVLIEVAEQTDRSVSYKKKILDLISEFLEGGKYQQAELLVRLFQFASPEVRYTEFAQRRLIFKTWQKFESDYKRIVVAWLRKQNWRKRD